jgi:hypothetical protein
MHEYTLVVGEIAEELPLWRREIVWDLCTYAVLNDLGVEALTGRHGFRIQVHGRTCFNGRW